MQLSSSVLQDFPEIQGTSSPSIFSALDQQRYKHIQSEEIFPADIFGTPKRVLNVVLRLEAELITRA